MYVNNHSRSGPKFIKLITDKHICFAYCMQKNLCEQKCLNFINDHKYLAAHVRMFTKAFALLCISYGDNNCWQADMLFALFPVSLV